jgi:hypothetical protein
MKLQNVKQLTQAELRALVTHEYQQAITPKKVRNYIQSMQKHGFWKSHPIVWFSHQGKKMIIWGHHRREAAVSLGIAAWGQEATDLTMEASIPLIQEENWSTWKVLETIKREVRTGNPDYMILKSYIDRGMSVAAASSVLSGQSASSTNHLERVKKGIFKVTTTDHADKLMAVIDSFPTHPVVRNCNFIKALSRCLFVPEFDFISMIRKIKINPALLENRSTIKEFSAVIERVYNYKTAKQIPLAFMADEVAKNRSAA